MRMLLAAFSKPLPLLRLTLEGMAAKVSCTFRPVLTLIQLQRQRFISLPADMACRRNYDKSKGGDYMLHQCDYVRRIR